MVLDASKTKPRINCISSYKTVRDIPIANVVEQESVCVFCFLAFHKMANLRPCICVQLGIRVKVEARQINTFIWQFVIPRQFFICQ
jgi:hypothetical protein